MLNAVMQLQVLCCAMRTQAGVRLVHQICAERGQRTEDAALAARPEDPAQICVSWVSSLALAAERSSADAYMQAVGCMVIAWNAAVC